MAGRRAENKDEVIKMKIIVTGGAGFIGSNFLIKYVNLFGQHTFINLDNLTYAANLANLKSIEQKENYRFERCDIADGSRVTALFHQYQPDTVIHFAAESHVDRSILGPAEFMKTNIIGTFNLLEACRDLWADSFAKKRFHHVSTDEVYGSLGEAGLFSEESRYDPSSPYSASKASSDHLVRAYHRTYGMPITITNCSNNYGPYQFPEKLIPLMIANAVGGKALPVYGRGENIRDWLYVEDHCEAVWTVLEKGTIGETYNVGGSNEWKNIDIVREICLILAEKTHKPAAEYLSLVQFVSDRAGHDLRYAIDARKISEGLNWQPRETFKTGLRKTVQWYLDHPEWLENVQSGSYKNWLMDNYAARIMK